MIVPCLDIESADNLTRVPLTGGGVALLYASKELEKLQTANFDQKIGVQIIQNALKVHILFAWRKRKEKEKEIHTNETLYLGLVYRNLWCLVFIWCMDKLGLIDDCSSYLSLVKHLFSNSHLFSIQTPVHTIASNAGVEGAVVVGKLLEQDNPDLGYDAAKGQYISLQFLFLFLFFSEDNWKKPIFHLYRFVGSIFLVFLNRWIRWYG